MISIREHKLKHTRQYNSKMIVNWIVARLYVPGHCVYPDWQNNGLHEMVYAWTHARKQRTSLHDPAKKENTFQVNANFKWAGLRSMASQVLTNEITKKNVMEIHLLHYIYEEFIWKHML